MKYSNLLFFDKNGFNINLEPDYDNEVWEGKVFMSTVSVNLFEVANIFILETYNDNGTIKYRKPHSYVNSTGSPGNLFTLSWEDDVNNVFNIFTFDITNEKPDLLEHTTLDLEVDAIGDLNNEALQINISLMSSKEDSFERVLLISDNYDDHVIAKITFYGETVGEDERLKYLTADIGYSILNDDFNIFKESDVNELAADFKIINNKRKEMMMEGSNITPYIGSYKALINAIKFFGYDNITLKEYWENVDKASIYYGKYKFTKVIDLFDSVIDFNDDTTIVPSKSFRKTNKIGLFYRLNTIKPELRDEDDLPQTREVFDFTIEEVLIKLYGLKLKLMKDFLWTNTKIVDIVGEADYFIKHYLTANASQNKMDVIYSGKIPSFNITTPDGTYFNGEEQITTYPIPLLTVDAVITGTEIGGIN